MLNPAGLSLRANLSIGYAHGSGSQYVLFFVLLARIMSLVPDIRLHGRFAALTRLNRNQVSRLSDL